MADEKPKFDPKILSFKGGRLAFAKIHRPEKRKNKQGQVRADAKAQYSYEILLDPSNKEHAATIAEIRAEAIRALNHKFGEGGWSMGMPNFHMCFGLGNDLPKLGRKISDGYKDMFWIRMKRNEEDGPPLLANRRGALVTQGQPECPFSGCYVNGRFTIWAYDNESKGANATGRSLQFVDKGKAFGGGGALDAEEEFEALGDEPGAQTSNVGADPFAIQ